jgi:hypothetical protein
VQLYRLFICCVTIRTRSAEAHRSSPSVRFIDTFAQKSIVPVPLADILTTKTTHAKVLTKVVKCPFWILKRWFRTHTRIESRLHITPMVLFFLSIEYDRAMNVACTNLVCCNDKASVSYLSCAVRPRLRRACQSPFEDEALKGEIGINQVGTLHKY